MEKLMSRKIEADVADSLARLKAAAERAHASRRATAG